MKKHFIMTALIFASSQLCALPVEDFVIVEEVKQEDLCRIFTIPIMSDFISFKMVNHELDEKTEEGTESEKDKMSAESEKEFFKIKKLFDRIPYHMHGLSLKKSYWNICKSISYCFAFNLSKKDNDDFEIDDARFLVGIEKEALDHNLIDTIVDRTAIDEIDYLADKYLKFSFTLAPSEKFSSADEFLNNLSNYFNEILGEHHIDSEYDLILQLKMVDKNSPVQFNLFFPLLEQVE